MMVANAKSVVRLFAIVLLVFNQSGVFASEWQWQNPLPQGNPLLGVWGSSDSDVFAVGDCGTIIHYNGTSWNAMSGGTTQWLSGVWGSSGSNVFAVGANGTIMRYNGASWSAMSSGTTQYLQGVWGSSGSDVFAVGENGTILHCDGATWNAMNSNTAQKLYGVWGSLSSNVFAVGENGTILLYDGASWSAMNSNTVQNLYGVWGNTDSDVFAVGGNGTILHYNGASWNAISSGTTQLFRGVWGSSGNDVYAVGGGSILHYNGASWSWMSSGTDQILLGVWGRSGSNIFAVGQRGMIVHYNGASWSAMSSGTTQYLNGVWGDSSNDVFSVGREGTIARYNGTSWGAMSSGTTKYLYGVWGSSNDDVFAVGFEGTIVHYNGASWSAMIGGATQNLYGVWGSSGSDVFAVGENGTIMYYNGASWNATIGGTTQNLYGVWGNSGSDVFAVGDNGTIVHYDGSSWSAMSSDTTQHLRGVWGSSDSDVYVVGDNGTIVRYNGASWSATSSGTTQNLYGVRGHSASDVFAVGYSGTIVRYNGTSWSAMNSGTHSSLNGVWGSSGNDMFIVGNDGTILHYGSENINTPENFPDPNFRAAVETIMDVSPGEAFTADEVAVITTMNVSLMNIASVSGIEFFRGLNQLNCGNNQLTSLDVSHNVALENLNCYYNQLTSLDVTKNTVLTHLECSNNQLSSLDVSHNAVLQNLNCYRNQLTSLDVSHNTVLNYLYCFQNQFTSLDIIQNAALITVDCNLNQITSLDVSHNIALENLNCSCNLLTSLDVSHNSVLVNLWCLQNQLTSLDVSHNSALVILHCWQNQLMSLDVFNNLNLREIRCGYNHLTNISCFATNIGINGGDVLDIRYNDLDDGDWNDVVVLKNRVGSPTISGDPKYGWLQSGFAYSPQNNLDPYDCTQYDPTLSLNPSAIAVYRGQDVEIAVNVSDASSVIGYRVALDLDPSKVSYTEGSATKVGTSTETGWGPIVVNSGSPELAIFTCACASGTITSGSASLMKFQLHVNGSLPDFTPITVTFNPLTSLNEDAIAYNAEIWNATVIGPNNRPMFTGGPNQYVLEDTGMHEIFGWATNIIAGPAYESWQSLHFTLDVDHPQLFFGQPTLDAAGTLRYTLASDEFGICNATAVLHDSGGTADGGIDSSTPYTVSFTVNPVNDAPSFIAGATAVVLNATGGQHEFPGWATAINAGPVNESSQSLWFIVETNHDHLFSATPTIDAGGTLRFTPAAGAHGVVKATAALYDNGGIANGGIDKSSPALFAVKIYIPFLWGDLNANGQAGAVDASLLLRYAADLLDEFPGYPAAEYPEYYPDPTQPWNYFPLAADVNADGIAGTWDASLVLQKYVWLIQWFPADTSHDQWGPDAPLPPGKAVKRSAPRTMNAILEPLENAWKITLQIDDAEDVQGLRAVLLYDPAQLRFNEEESGWLVSSGLMAVNDTEPGRLVMAGALGQPLLEGPCDLLTVTFDAVGNGSDPLRIEIDEDQTIVNDGHIHIQLNYLQEN